MSESDFYMVLLQENILMPWVQLPLLERWFLATLIIGSPATFFFETYKYARLLKSIKTVDTIRLAPISVKGRISEMLGADGVELALHTELYSITETFQKVMRGHASLYPVETFSKSPDYYAVAGRLQAHLPSGLLKHKEYRVEKELAIEIGTVHIPLNTIVNFFVVLLGVLPVPYRRRYFNSLINLSLVSSDDEMQLIVSRRGRQSSLFRTAKTDDRPANWMALSRIKTSKNLSDLKDLLRDAAFIILQFHGCFGDRNWESMRRLVDGLNALDEYRRTGLEDAINRAKESFCKAAMADPDNNYESLYFYGSMLMLQRKREPIETAIRVFKLALKTQELKLRALVHTGLAFCYAQAVHRLAESEALAKACDHAEQAKKDWEEAASSDSLHPLILSTLALVKIVDEGSDEKRVEAKKQFAEAAGLYIRAIKMEPDNGMFHNNLGWIMLKLAQWGEKELRQEDTVPKEISGNPAETAEKYFHNSLNLNKKNKLTHANLCLLYATPWYLEKNKALYLEKCRSHGRKAIELDPGYINGYRDFSLSLLRYGKSEEAYKYLKKALQYSSTVEKKDEIAKDVRKVLNEIDISSEELNRWHKSLSEISESIEGDNLS